MIYCSTHTHTHTHVYSHLSFLIITHTSTPLLSLRSFPLHVLHAGVCAGLWKQLGLIIDVLHFNQFHHSVRLIKVSSILPGAVCVCACECVCVCVCMSVNVWKKDSVWDSTCVFSCSWGLHAPFYISEYMGILYFRNKRWERFCLSLFLPLSPSFSFLLSLSVPPLSLSPGRILNAINTAALLPANY